MWHSKKLSDEQLEKLMYEEDSITDNMAIDSECEGDSDGEDNMPESMNRSSKSISLRSSTKSSPLTLEQDQQFSSDPEQKQDSEHFFTTQTSSKKANTYQNFSEDSDDSVADPDYEEENKSKRRKFYFTENLDPESSEVEDEVIEEEIVEETRHIVKTKKGTSEKRFVWTKCTQMPDMHGKAQFTENVGPNDIDVDSLLIFLKFLPDNFLTKIVTESNIYAQQLHKNDDFTIITLAELKAFFGILIFMGIHPLPSIKLY
ncbi:hypothetical protein JTB14_036611 [Gonioctena quinquepunctata]|nr:hypothetical protein JTB14_036611 [Gonioctena quinquepunctata]